MKITLSLLLLFTSIYAFAQNKELAEKEEAAEASQRILQKRRERMSGLPMRQEHESSRKKNKQKSKQEKLDD